MRVFFILSLVMVSAAVGLGQPGLTDPDLVVEEVVELPSTLTGVAFIGEDDMLVNRKNTGEVLRVVDGVLQGAVLDLPVNTQSERGLLDIRLDPEFETNKLVYVFYTVAPSDGATPTANRVSRFTWNGSALVNEDVLIDLPVTPGPNHDGGVLAFGPPSAALADQKLFIVIGDLNRNGKMQNFLSGADPDFTGQILRLNRDGSTPQGAERGPFYDVAGGDGNLEVLYAYGVRNSYGMDFDPVTGRLWDTENGPGTDDEINIVDPGFNSGWETVMGKAPTPLPPLVTFGGRGTYAEPKFVWEATVAPTAIHFLRGTGLGSKYENGCFVGEVNDGNLYHFPMNGARDGFVLTGDLADEVVNFGESAEQVIIGSGFGGIIDLETGPDGCLYVVTFNRVYRIRSTGSSVANWELFE